MEVWIRLEDGGLDEDRGWENKSPVFCQGIVLWARVFVTFCSPDTGLNIDYSQNYYKIIFAISGYIKVMNKKHSGKKNYEKIMYPCVFVKSPLFCSIYALACRVTKKMPF